MSKLVGPPIYTVSEIVLMAALALKGVPHNGELEILVTPIIGDPAHLRLACATSVRPDTWGAHESMEGPWISLKLPAGLYDEVADDTLNQVQELAETRFARLAGLGTVQELVGLHGWRAGEQEPIRVRRTDRWIWVGLHPLVWQGILTQARRQAQAELAEVSR